MKRLSLFWAVSVAVAVLGPTAGEAQRLPRYEGPPTAVAMEPPEVAQARSALDAAFDAGWAGDSDLILEHLQRAERLLADALSSDPRSRSAAEALGVVLFYQGYYGKEGGFSRTVTFLTRVLEVDPLAIGAGQYLAHAYHHMGEDGRAREYADWVVAASPDPAVVGEMEGIRTALDDAFLGSWYEYGGFYESDEARVTRFDARTKKVTTELQITPQLEMQLAAQSLQQLTADFQPYDDPVVQRYLQGLVDKLTVRSPVGPPITNTVEVVWSDQVNATALPGKIMVHTGLLRFVENEAELVAVLSHELAHIYAHHAARQLVGNTRDRGIASSLISITGVRDRLSNDLYRQLLDKGVDLTLNLLLKGYQRGHEEEADRYGTHLAFNAGYNPTFMTSFFIRLYEHNPRSPVKLLATHPPYTERIESTSDYLEQFPLHQELQIDSRSFQDMKARIP